MLTVAADSQRESVQARLMLIPRLVGPEWQLVANNPNSLNGGGLTPTQFLKGAKTAVTARVRHQTISGEFTIPSVRLVYANYTGSHRGFGESPGWNPIFVKAAIESGREGEAPTPVLFDGKPVVEIPPFEYRISDPVPVNLTGGGAFYTRTTQIVSSESDLLCGGYTTLAGFAEGVRAGDFAYGGAIPAVNRSDAYSPSAILGFSQVPLRSAVICGDSLPSGAGDAGYRSGSGGFTERALTGQFLPRRTDGAALCGFVRISRGGESTVGFLESTIRHELGSLAATAIVTYLNNDIGDYHPSTYPESAIKANLVTSIRRWTDLGKRVVMTTCPPRTISSDGFMSSAKQALRVNEWLRVEMNRWVRDPNGLLAEVGADPGQVQIWDIAAAVEVNSKGAPALNGGRWRSEPLLLQSGWVSELTNSTPASFADLTQRSSVGHFSGACVTFTSGANAKLTRGIVDNDESGRFFLRSGFSFAPSAGDAYAVVAGLTTTDGIHPSAGGHAAIAASFDPLLLGP